MALGRIIKKWFSSEDKEPDVTEQTFGNVIKFRVGSTVNISPAFTVMVDENSMFGTFFGSEDFSSLVVNTVLSFEFDGLKVFRLYCGNLGGETPALVQLQEDAEGSESFMLFLLTQDIAIQDEDCR